MDIKGLGPVDHGSSASEELKQQAQEISVASQQAKEQVSPLSAVVKNADKEQVISLAQEAVDHLNEMMKDMDKDLRFHLFVDGTDFAYVEVINPETNEVVKEIPPEELIEAMIKIHDAVGMIIDKYI